MATSKQDDRRGIPALVVHQWLRTWNDIKWDSAARQAKPPEEFYVFRLNAAELKALTGVYRRSTADMKRRAEDVYVQRSHESRRSETIQQFVRYGYPWCEMSDRKRRSGKFTDLKKPGWLPTAIVVNILEPDDPRHIDPADVIDIDETGDRGIVRLMLPKSFDGSSWRCASIPPMEVIDGQHRLWAFEGYNPPDSFELPVVAFHGLDRSWQAYLFWSINVTPKRINASLAFDLYPLLRTEDWLERFHGHSIYREARAQEIVEALWSHTESPWHQRINMLGERGLKVPMVSQAAWIRSLMATCLKQWEGRGTRIGGLFGAPMGRDKPNLPWSRAQQAAFLMGAGQALRDAVKSHRGKWTKALRSEDPGPLYSQDDDPAFCGRYSLLGTDQGIRGFLYTLNDLCYVSADDLSLEAWQHEEAAATEEEEVLRALETLEEQPVHAFVTKMAIGLASYDWRTSSAPGLDEEERLRQSAFRGSSGYRELRLQLLQHLQARVRGRVSGAAHEVRAKLE